MKTMPAHIPGSTLITTALLLAAVVWPAAGLIVLAKEYGAKVLEFNIARSEASPYVDVGLYGPSGQILPLVLAKM